MLTSTETDKLYKALDSFHQKTNLVKATKENPYFKSMYADYNVVVSETKPDLIENDLRVKQTITNIDGKTAIRTRLTHIASSQFIEDVSPVAHKDNDPQSQGSGITYGKRYAYVAMLDLLVDQDDDGSLASGLTKVAEKQKLVDERITIFSKATSEKELKEAFIASGQLMKDPRIISAKDARKAELANENS